MAYPDRTMPVCRGAIVRNHYKLTNLNSIPLKNDIPNYGNYLELMNSLEVIKNNNAFNTLLTSWTPPLADKNEIGKLIDQGEEYMKQIDAVVQVCYRDKYLKPLESYKSAVEQLGLPPFLVNPIVDKAFRSHLNS